MFKMDVFNKLFKFPRISELFFSFTKNPIGFEKKIFIWFQQKKLKRIDLGEEKNELNHIFFEKDSKLTQKSSKK